jgi:Fe-S-cluster-containing hydrogenase component 2/thioredoxin reductase
MSHVLVEAARRHANTVQQYQLHKHVMAEPSMLPLRSDVGFKAGRREQILESWERAIQDSHINIRFQSEVTCIEGALGDFRLALKSGEIIRAKHVILALGVQGNPRRLTMPGADRPCVQYTLESAQGVQGEHVVVIGAGDAAIENAVSLVQGNKVTLLNRGSGFPRAKEGNAARIARAIAAGEVECLSGAEVRSLEEATDAPAPYQLRVATPEGERLIPCHRVIARLGAVPARALMEGAGVRLQSQEPDALPDLSAAYESSVPGLYIIGSLAGFPLIKQAMNQGYEVVERLAGHAVVPADHEVLVERLRALSCGTDMDQAVSRIHSTVRMFRAVGRLALRELLLVSSVLTPAPGERLYAQGDYASSLYNVLAGEVRLGDGDRLQIRVDAGLVFGEMALVSGRPHETYAIAGEGCIILSTPHTAIRRLLRAEASVRSYIDTVYALRALRVLLLPHASPGTVYALSRTVRLHRVKGGETLFAQGEAADRFYVVRSGSVTLSRATAQGETVVAYCAAGRYLDAAGCLAGEPTRTLSARATIATEALSIDHSIMRRVAAADPRLREKLRKEATAELARAAHMHARPGASHVFSYLMSHGLGEATSVLVIDENLCVGCDQCERACASTHDGISRLDRSAGPSLHSLHIPTACRHCEHPHCMRDCPPGAIHRLPDGEVSIDSTCIGCGNCVDNCPYGVIRLAEITPKRSLLGLLGARPREEAVKTAVKCDSCAGLRGGPACVRSCPTGAAIRIHAEDVLRLATERAAVRAQG